MYICVWRWAKPTLGELQPMLLVPLSLNLTLSLHLAATWLWYEEGGLWGDRGEVSFILNSSQGNSCSHLELVSHRVVSECDVASCCTGWEELKGRVSC